MQHEFSRALAAARHYRSIGLVPLPSRMDKKMPMLSEFKAYQTEPVPKVVYAPDEWRTTNLQLMTGARTGGATKIIVIDLDGEEAKEAWKRLCKLRDHVPRGAWICETGSGGKHIYYRLPVGLESCSSRLLWGLYDPMGGKDHEGGWVKHKAVQLLGDGVLAVAPPSKHVETGVEYRWLGKYSPSNFPLPAEAPDWLLEMPGLKLPASPKAARSQAERRLPPATPRLGQPNGQGKPSFDRDAVIRALSPAEKLRIAREWGLRLCSDDHRRNWVECHAIGRADARPSAGFDPSTGVYHDFGSAIRLSFFDIPVALGLCRDWHEALQSVSTQARL